MSQQTKAPEILEEKDVPCENCGHVTHVKVTKKPTKSNYTIEEQETINTNVKEKVHQEEHKEEPKKFTHEDLAKMIPKGVNFATCPDGNCGATLKNARGLSTKFKTCPNCERNAVRAKAESCPFCNNKKFDDEPDIDDISEKILDDDEE